MIFVKMREKKDDSVLYLQIGLDKRCEISAPLLFPVLHVKDRNTSRPIINHVSRPFVVFHAEFNFLHRVGISAFSRLRSLSTVPHWDIEIFTRSYFARSREQGRKLGIANLIVFTRFVVLAFVCTFS